MRTRNGFIGVVPQQDSTTGNSGELSVNSHNIEKSRNNLKNVDLPPASHGLRLFLDAGQEPSYISGSTWTDLSGNGRNATLYNVNHTSATPSYFNLADSFSFATPANTLGSSNSSVSMVIKTDDGQSMLVTDDGNQDYLGAYRSGNGYYHNNVGGGKNLYINGTSQSNLYSTIRTNSSLLVTVTDCDFSFGSNRFVFNTYGSFQFGSGRLYAVVVHDGNLSSSQVTDLYNWFNSRGYIGQ